MEPLLIWDCVVGTTQILYIVRSLSYRKKDLRPVSIIPNHLLCPFCEIVGHQGTLANVHMVSNSISIRFKHSISQLIEMPNQIAVTQVWDRIDSVHRYSLVSDPPP